MIAPIKEKLHTHAQHVYHYGEHGCAVAYALHEFAGFHFLVLTLSGVLVAGVLLVTVDMVMGYFGD